MGFHWARIASGLHKFIRSNTYGIVAAGVCLAVLSLYYTRGHLEFWTERNVLISQESASAKLYGEYRKEFKDDYVILVLRSKDLEQAKGFASELGKRLEAEETIQEVRFIGRSGKLVLQIYPKEDIWELEPQRRFVEELASVTPAVTGTAVQNYDATKSLLDAYVQGGLYAVCAIVLILFVDFRHPLLVLLTLLPLVFGGLWTLLGMKILKMAFNPANLVIIPLLVGIGVDNGIHVIRHFLGSGSSEDEIAGSSMGRAITLSTLTTMAGFGSLIIARHQGIQSVGALLTLAMASCLLGSLVVLPSLLRILPEQARHRIWRMGQPK